MNDDPEAEMRFAQRIIALSPDIVYVYDLARHALHFTNRGLDTLLGYPPGTIASLETEALRQLIPPEDLERLYEHGSLLAAARDGEVLVVEFRLKKPEEGWRWLRIRESIFARTAEGLPQSKLGIAQDISAEKQREELLRQLSLVDELTGLGNRRSFEFLALQHLKVVSRNGSDSVLVYLDLDNFKGINDSYGHAEGDEALREIAGLLRKSFRSSDIVARLGGDEFVILLMDTDEDQARRLVARLRAAVDRRNAAKTKPYELLFSAGLSACKDTEFCDLPRLMESADRRMYEYKETHRRPTRRVP